MGKIQAICISEKRGTAKNLVDSAIFHTEFGIVGDAHAGNWHRQVSFLAQAAIDEFKTRGAKINFGDFGENIIAEGIDFKSLPVGTRLQSGEVFFEVTQIGKKCHSHCAIYQQIGDCIMPREGIFARVLHGGKISVGDDLKISAEKMPLDAAIITSSDKGYSGEREDFSGAKVAEILAANGYQVSEKIILPDEKNLLAEKMIEFANLGIGLILTTGGTGFSPRDVTPEATLEVCERLAPGIPEAMRNFSMQITKRAMLSRAAAGIRKRSLIVNLPGSPKAVEECLNFILPTLKHGLEILRGDNSNCAR